VSVGITFEGLDRHTGTQIDPGIALHLGGDVADYSAECADEWCTGAFRDRYVQPEITAD
jgi:hypothetical protein